MIISWKVSELTSSNKIDWVPILRRAAESGKNAILRNYDMASRTKVVKHGVGGDLTLKIDEVSERAIHESLKRDLAEESFVFLSEEMGETSVRNADSPPIIICDPLDGSHNAQVGIPFFAVSLSVIEIENYKKNRKTDLARTFGGVTSALISSVMTQDEYFAVKSRGAYHNGIKLKQRNMIPFQRAQTLLVETGDIDFLRESLLSRLSKRQINKTRILGSAALSYCLLASGSADALIFAQPGGARTIDSPAGYLIAREVGCVFSDLSGKNPNVDNVEVGFHSKIDLIGARNTTILSRLRRLVSLP